MLNGLKKKVIDANIEYHTKFADIYDNQPHFFPENKRRVEKILLECGKRSGFDSFLDIGCGTGFMLNIAKKHFTHVIGVDITPRMIEKVDSTKNVDVCIANSESLPFEHNSFNVCTAYGFLHHLLEFKSTLMEVYRVLKKGGMLYTDQDPNLHFWSNDITEKAAKVLERKVNIPRNITRLAEYHDTLGGIDGSKIEDLLYTVGYRDVKVVYRWFVPEKTGMENKKSNMKYIKVEARK
jgi:ubiquinone/menaquinone biosynthesis C-methylase UbiE